MEDERFLPAAPINIHPHADERTPLYQNNTPYDDDGMEDYIYNPGTPSSTPTFRTMHGHPVNPSDVKETRASSSSMRRQSSSNHSSTPQNPSLGTRRSQPTSSYDVGIKYYPYNMRTLSSENLAGDKDWSGNNKTIAKLSDRLRYWKCGCLSVLVLGLLTNAILILGLCYFLFLQVPLVYIDQIQVTHIPVVDRYCGFRVVFNANNPNVVSTSINSIYLQVAIVDPQTQASFLLDTPIQNSTTVQVGAYTNSDFVVEALLNLGENQYFYQLQKLILTSRFGIKIEGKIGVTAVAIHTQKITKYQQLFSSANSRSGVPIISSNSNVDDDISVTKP